MSSFQKGPLLYEGKAKRIFEVIGESGLVWQDFKNSLTAFNAEKKATMEGKGRLNALIATSIYRFLEAQGLQTHSVQVVSETEWITKKLQMVPLEVVVRNIFAGSTAKKFQIEEGTPLEQPLVEFYYKKDELGDPFISDEQALMLKAVNDPSQLSELKHLALSVNRSLKEFFAKCEIDLVDFKLEFGSDDSGTFLLADEISPDSCRLWDQKTGEKMDKDRFRRDLGHVLEMYQEVWQRIQNQWSQYV